MIVFSDAVPGPNGVTFVVHGDDVSKALVIDLSKSPFSLSFTGPFPTAVVVDAPGAAALAANQAGAPILTITYTTPPPSTQTIGMNVAFRYPSL